MKKLKDMTPEERRAFIEGATERNHKREYDSARIIANRPDLPEWEDLTEDQRERVRAENVRFQEEMNSFGAQLSQGIVPTR